jgi:hypothetical protein
MSERKVIFAGLDPNKETGICEPEGGSWDNGIVVNIRKDCVACRQGKCMMFEEKNDSNSQEVIKEYTPNEPEFKISGD